MVARTRRSMWANRSKALAVQVTIIVIGWACAIVVGGFLYRNALKDKEQEFRLRCLNRKQVMKAEMGNNLNTSFVVVGLLSAKPDINQSHWDAFTKYTDFLRLNSSRLFYMQRVLDRDRAAFEAEWKGPILEFAPNLDIVHRTPDAEYAPIVFRARTMKNLTLVDPTTLPIIRNAVQRARDTGKVSMSPPDKYRGIWRLGAYLPFYADVGDPQSLHNMEHRRQACVGYVGISVDIYDLFASVLSRYQYDPYLDFVASYAPQRVEDFLPSHGCSTKVAGCHVVIYGQDRDDATLVSSWSYGFQTFQLKCYAKDNIRLSAMKNIIAWPLLMVVVFHISAVFAFRAMRRLRAVEGDVTEMEKLNNDLKIAKQAAEAADKAKSSFLATVSHEIRTPMNGMIGMTNLLLGTDLTQQQLEYVKIAQHSGNALIALINDVLDLSKIEAGGMELESVTFDIRMVVDDVLSLFEDKVQQKEIEVSALIHETVPNQVVGDPGRLRQVLINLVGNAMKFTKQGSIFVCVRMVDESWQSTVVEDSTLSSTPSVDSDSTLLPLKDGFAKSDGTLMLDGGHREDASRKSMSHDSLWTFSSEAEDVPPRLSMYKVALGTKESVKKWRNWQPRPAVEFEDELRKLKLVISVEDTGIGIPLQIQHRLFQPFLQANSGTAREYGGTGIGLSISQKLVKLMDGELSVESQPGEGSTFEFTLKLGKETESSRSRSTHSDPQQDKLRGVKVLLVDPHFVRQEVVMTYMRKSGLLVEACEDTAMAENLVVRQEGPLFQAAIVDIQFMEIESAASFAQSVRSKPGFQTFPLIALTQQSNKVVWSQLEKAGFTSTIHSPLRHATLAASLQKVLGLRSQGPTKRINPYAHMLLKKRVLVVDDNLINRKVASSMLSRYGAAVLCVNGGVEALDALEGETFDLVLMDIQMPEMDGYEATRRIRQREIQRCSQCKNLASSDLSARSNSTNQSSEEASRVAACPHHQTPVVAVTADVMKGTHELCLNAGMDDYVPKPLDQRQLHSLLERFLKNDLVNRRGASGIINRPPTETS